jgi:excinuclease UvrABC nuclease subunit
VIPERAALLTDLPHARGVYVLRGRRGEPLYVGASRDVRSRVASHLGDRKDLLPGRDRMARRVRSIRWIPTGSELETLLLEARLIRRRLPPYNRSIRNYDRYAYLRLDLTDRFPRIRVTAVAEGPDGPRYGPWRKEQRASRVAWAVRRAFGLRPCTRDLSQGSLFPACERPGVEACAAPCDPSRSPDDYGRCVEAARAFLEGREMGAAETIEDEEARELLAQSFEMLARLREAATSPDEILRLPPVEGEPPRLLLVRSGRPYGPFPMPSDRTRTARLLHRIRRIRPPDPVLPYPKAVVDDVKILASRREEVPPEGRFPLDVEAANLLAQ